MTFRRFPLTLLALAACVLLSGCPREAPPEQSALRPDVEVPPPVTEQAQRQGAPLPVWPGVVSVPLAEEPPRPPALIPEPQRSAENLPAAYSQAQEAIAIHPSSRVAAFSNVDDCAGASALKSGSFEDGTAWAEGGRCARFPLATIWSAALTQEAMIGPKITKLVSFGRSGSPASRGGERVRLVLQSAQKDFFCITPQWTMDWTFRVLRGTVDAPELAEINFDRLAGETGPWRSNVWYGSYMEKWSGSLLLSAKAGERTSIHMRIEIKGKNQDAQRALETVQDYFSSLEKRANGQSLPGVVPEPSCPAS